MFGRLFLVSLAVSALGAAFVIGHNRNVCGSGCAQYDVELKKQFAAKLAKRTHVKELGPVSVCFAEGTDPLLMNAFQQALQDAQDGAWPDPNARYQLTGRWSGAAGSPRVLRWSFVPDGLNIPNGVGEPAAPSTLFASMDAKFGGNRALWIAKFEQIFQRWSQLSGLTYVRVTDGADPWDDGAAWGTAGADGLRGDVRISSKNIDGASSILAYNMFPSNGDMVIDSSDNWGNSTNDYRFLRNTLGHEHGHGIGLLHVCPIQQSKLMEPYLATGFDGPQQDDVRAAQRQYGDSLEPNDNIASASTAGAIAPASNVTIGTSGAPANASTVSIDRDGAQDFYKITTTGPVKLVTTVTPIGTNYTSGPQTSQCDTGTAFNALAAANLALEVQSAGGTVLGSATGNAVGLAETATVDLPTPGSYYVRVYETDSPTQTQLYKLNLVGQTLPAIISGRITFLDWVNPNRSLPLTVTVRNSTTQAIVASFNTTTDTDGDYSVNTTALTFGQNYTLQIDSSVWLRKSVEVLAAPAITHDFSVINGDADGSGEVDAADIDRVIAHFGSTGVPPTDGDLDGSGEVDAADIDIAISNFGGTDN